MIQIKFKNLEKSELAREAVFERVGALVEKFADLNESRITITLEMENSPLQAGPDLFKIKLRVTGGRFDGITITKSDSSLYKALAHLADHMLEKLNRSGDKRRVKGRAKARQLIVDLSLIDGQEKGLLY
ncbi:MAG: HPF/RaiA family ribosome-associated protein [Oligoflexales bacterium]|nr:HPF/RaiA family ribosome-associated protein [Oligoflexales bacterium]